MRSVLLVLSILVGLAMLGCGGGWSGNAPSGGGGSGGSGGGSGGFGLTFEQRDAALTGLADKFASLPHTDPDNDNRALADYILTRPEFDGVYVEPKSGVLAHFKGGPTVAVINNQPYNLYAKRAGNIRDVTRVSTPAVLGRNAFVFNNFSALCDLAFYASAAATNGHVASNLTAKGYQVTNTDGSLAHLSQVTSTSIPSDVALVYFNGHGTVYNKSFNTDGHLADGDIYAVRSSTLINALDDQTWAADMQAGRVGPALTPNNNGRLILQKTYYITERFVKYYWHLGPKSVVFANTCFSNADLSNAMRQAVSASGASVYLGWDYLVKEQDSETAAVNLFALTTGGTSGIVPASPPQRPFPISTTLNYLQRIGIGVSGDSFIKSYLTLSPMAATYGEYVTPSIEHVYVDEINNTLQLYGWFGTDRPSVSLSGTDLPVQSSTPTLIHASIPTGKLGDVVVRVAGHSSNAVPLSRWKGKITFTKTFDGTQQLQITADVSVRADGHGYRIQPGTAPGFTGVFSLATVERSATIQYTASGSWSDGDTTKSISGNGAILWAAGLPGSPAGENAAVISAESQGGSPSNVFKVHLGFAKGRAYDMLTVTPRDGAYTTPQDISQILEFQSVMDRATLAVQGGTVTLDAKTKLQWSGFSVEGAPGPSVQR